MSRGFILYDDANARAAEPFALTRPFSELRAGAMTVRERWELALGRPAAGFVSAAHLATFDEFGAPGAVTGTLPAGTILVNSRYAPALGQKIGALSRGSRLGNNGVVAAVALHKETPVASLASGRADLGTLGGTGRAHKVEGWWLTAAWDLVRLLPEMLASDATVLATSIPAAPPSHVSVLGAHRFAVARGAYVEPHVVIDTTDGDVVILEGARIDAFARIGGPCVIGPHVRVAGGRYRCISVGAHSRICGEMSEVIVAGYSNKAHDGFIGHSVLGRWVNLGAGTTTSNLKNSYGPVRLHDSRGTHETAMQFLGSLVGDHVKTAIGTRLTTGTIVGAGANVFGDHAAAGYIPPFSWGDIAPFRRFELDKFLDVASHVMRRRDVTMTTGVREALTAAWHATSPATGTPRRRR